MKTFAVLFLLALSSAAFAAVKPEKQTINSLGAERTYYTFVPEKLTAPAPLLLLLHGSGRDGMSQINEWKELAEKEGIIIIAPDSGVMESQYFGAAGVHAGAMGEDFYPYLDLAKRKIPITIWVGTEDPYFKLTLVKATQTELNKHGFDAKVVEIKGHDHNYYAVSKDLNPKIWDFLRSNKLDAEATWQVYQRK